MASTGKKGKKNKGKTLALTDFLANTKRSWSDEIEEADRLNEYNKKSVLPEAPRAARAIDESLIPKNPPYVAYLSNLSFEVDEKDISDVFSKFNITSVSLPREENTERIKGFGYVVFEDKLSFIDALQMYEVTIKSRRVRIEIADQEGDRRRRPGKLGRDGRDNYDSERGDQRSSSDWRMSGRSDYLSKDNRMSNRRDYSYRDRDGYRDRDRDGFRDSFRDRDGDRSSGFGDRETNWRDSERRFLNEREYRSSGFGSGLRRSYDDRNEGSSWVEPGPRPKIILNPRTIPLGESATKDDEKKESSASIFGQAKPVDTAARERQIEERLARERQLNKTDGDMDRFRTRNDDYYESRRIERDPEPREKAMSRGSHKDDDHEDSSSQNINNGQVSDSEETPSNRENDRNEKKDANDEPGKGSQKDDEGTENDKSDGEGRYSRQNRNENRFNDNYRESDRSYRRDDKYRADDRDRRDRDRDRDRDRRDYDRRDRGYDSEGRNRDSVGKYREDRERDRDEDGKRYNDRDIDNRRYQERGGGRHRDQDDHDSGRRQTTGDTRGSASGDRGTRQGGGGGGRGAPEKERMPPARDKPKEPKKNDETPRMPKLRENLAPNYIGMNKYCCLQEDEQASE